MGDKRVPTHFIPLSRDAKHRKIAAFDTEGTGQPGSFVCGALASDLGDYIFTNPSELLRALTAPELRGYWLFAHNLEYDLGVLSGGDLTPFSILFTETRILYAETQDPHGHKWRLCDSGNVFPRQSVADLGRLVGLDKIELPAHLFEHLKSGRPLSELTQAERDLVTGYCLTDARIVYLALELLQEELLSLGGCLKTTIAGCSMDLFRRKYLSEPWPVPHPGINNLARQGYYGARTEPYRLGRVNDVNAYDINSLYPSVQRDVEFPHPGFLSWYTSPPDVARMLGQPGLSQCKLWVPEADPPPLPARVGSRLYFPSGELTGVWPHNELVHALDCGVKLLNVDWSLVSWRSFNPFAEFIDDLYKRRMLHASDGDMRVHTFKLLLNSAYGRYGVNPEHPLSVLMPVPPDPDWATFQGGELRIIENRLYSLMPAEGARQPHYCNVPIAAYITAGARIRMHQELSRVVDDLVYTDTDSLFIQGSLPVGSGLGEMKQEHAGMDLWIVAPKEYAIWRGEQLIEAHAKGIPEDLRLVYLETGQALFDRPLNIREAGRRGLSPATWVEQLKKRRRQTPKRAPDLWGSQGQGYYRTRPWSLQELLALVPPQ